MLELKSYLLKRTVCSQVENMIYLSSDRLHPNSCKAQMIF